MKFALTFVMILPLAVLAKPPADSGPIAKFEFLSGHVQYKPKDGHWKDAKLGQSLSVDTELETGPRAKAVLVFKNGSTMALNALTRVYLDKYRSGTYGTQVVTSLRSGRVIAKIAKYQNVNELNYFRVRTPTTVAGVRGTIQEVGYTPDRGTDIKMHESMSEVVDRARAKSVVPDGGKSHISREGTVTSDKAAAKENTTTMASPHASTPGEAAVSYTTGDFSFSSNSSDFSDLLRIYERISQDIYLQNRDVLIFEKL